MGKRETEEREEWRVKSGVGPWDAEPDRVEFRTRAGLPAILRRSPWGAWCGYVAVAPHHTLHGKDYDQLGENDPTVHGGLTYCGPCQTEEEVEGTSVEKGKGNGLICHVPAPGEPDDVWWFGFDCAHGGDFVPGLGRFYEDDEYRDLAYVKKETEKLARQLKRATTRSEDE